MFFDNYCIPIFNGDVGAKTKKRLTEKQNAQTFYMVLSQLVNMALDYRYDFDGLPKTMYGRLIKQSLLFYGNVTMFNLDGVPIALPSAPDGQSIDVMGNTGGAYIFSRNGRMNFSVPLNYEYEAIVDMGTSMGNYGSREVTVTVDGKQHKVSDGVIVWENKSRVPFIWTVIYFAERIADTYRTLDLDRRWLKRPFIPRCEESEGKAFDENLRAFMNNEDINLSIKSRSLDKSDFFPVDMSPDLIEKVTQLVEWYYSQFKQLCGIDAHLQVDKKGENLISDEVNIDDMFIELVSESVVKEMNSQIYLFNSLTGNSIKAVSIREQKEKEAEEKALKAMKQEGNEDGKDKNISSNN